MELRQLVRSSAPAAMLSLANLFGNAVVFIAGVLLARILPEQSYAHYLIGANIAMLACVVVDAGVPTALVRLGVRTPARLGTLLHSALPLRIGAGVFVLFSAVMGSLLLPDSGMDSELRETIVAAAGCSIALGMMTLARAYHQSVGRHAGNAQVVLIQAIARMAALTGALVLGVTDVGLLLLAAYFLAPAIAAAPTLWSALRINAGSWCRPTSLELLRYGRWLAASAVLYQLCFTVPLLVVLRYAGAAQAATFGVALTFAALVNPINDAFRAYLLPTAASFRSSATALEFLARVRRITPLFVGGLILVVSIAAGACYFLFGQQFPGATLATALVLFATGLAMLGGIGNLVLHSFGASHLDAWANLGRLALVTILTLTLAPTMGAVGAGLGTALGILLVEAALAVIVSRRLARGDAFAQPGDAVNSLLAAPRATRT